MAWGAILAASFVASLLLAAGMVAFDLLTRRRGWAVLWIVLGLVDLGGLIAVLVLRARVMR